MRKCTSFTNGNHITINSPATVLCQSEVCAKIQSQAVYVPCLTNNVFGQMLFYNSKPCKHPEVPKDYFRQLFYMRVSYFQPFQILK